MTGRSTGAERPPREGLEPYAASQVGSRGRIHPESPPGYRSEYQRDRDRIVHSAAFRRLEYKTQVFVNHEGDMFRTRLTHSIEVSQIARTVARTLGLNEDLVEAIALAHDLGHTPFGHAGQDALDECLREFGGFEHNLQSLRVVDVLEDRYAEFQGLNLTFETREGILKHCSVERARSLGDVGRRFLDGGLPTLEAQLANVADEVAYNNHDVDDGLRAGLVTVEELREVALFREQHDAVIDVRPELSDRRVIHEVVRRMINRQVTDLVESSRDAIASAAPHDADEVRAAPQAMIRFSEEMHALNQELKRFLRTRMYRHYRVHRMSRKAQRIVKGLYGAFFDDIRLMPGDFRARATSEEPVGAPEARARVVADYVAGMTDRYAILEYQRIFDAAELT